MPLTRARLGPELARLAPSELILTEDREQDLRDLTADMGIATTSLGRASFDSTAAEKRLCAVFDVATARQHLVTVDPQAGFAISKFPEAERLLELSRTRTAAQVRQ